MEMLPGDVVSASTASTWSLAGWLFVCLPSWLPGCVVAWLPGCVPSLCSENEKEESRRCVPVDIATLGGGVGTAKCGGSRRYVDDGSESLDEARGKRRPDSRRDLRARWQHKKTLEYPYSGISTHAYAYMHVCSGSESQNLSRS